MPKRKQPIKTKKPRQKQKQKQIVKQNVKVNVQSSGGLGGQGGYMMPNYTPPVIYQSIPNNFRDTRGEDVILQRLSEVVDKFNAKPQPTQSQARVAPLPTEYNDSPVDALTEEPNNQLVTRSVFISRPNENDNLLSELPFNEDPMFELLNNRQNVKVSKIEDLTEKAKKRKEYYENFEKKAKLIKDKNEARRKQEAMTKIKEVFDESQGNKEPVFIPVATEANPEVVTKRKIIKPKK